MIEREPIDLAAVQHRCRAMRTRRRALGSTVSNDIPSWASARPPSGVPHLESAEGNVVAFIFGSPLRAGYEHARKNKILWIVRVVNAYDSRYESLFFVSANVRERGALVGIGTWAANASDFGPGDFRGWARTPKAYSLVPVNDLARRVSSRRGDLRPPGMTPAASSSQRCVSSAAPK